MSEKMIELTTEKLLAKFGAGNHKPGSGSASAFQGMLASQMMRTVIDLTTSPERKQNYRKHFSQLQAIKKQIDEEIYPQLVNLFQLDSEQFDKVIKLRKERDKNAKEYSSLRTQAQEALISSTETPLRIAALCLLLAEHADYVFKNGFVAARGDSAVAINCAISAVASCLSIVQLNLTTLPYNKKTEFLRKNAESIKSKYVTLNNLIPDSLSILEKQSLENKEFQKAIAVYQKGNMNVGISTNAQIEELVTQLQNTLWLQKDMIWKKDPISSSLDILQAEIVVKKVLGYSFQSLPTLGKVQHNEDAYEIAGLINKEEKLIQISSAFSKETQNFTLAHELGHAILHKQKVLHRDRPIDGSTNTVRSKEEMQADKFATYFLMPRKLVEDAFIEFFRTTKFILNEASVLALRETSLSEFKMLCGNKRGLALKLASSNYYGGKTFNPLAETFRVSVTTMAIRLEELELLEF